MSRSAKGSVTLMAYSISKKGKTDRDGGRIVGRSARAMLPINETVHVRFDGFDEVPKEFIEGFVYGVLNTSKSLLSKLRLENIPEDSLLLFRETYKRLL